jgi:microcystin-dependent protein
VSEQFLGEIRIVSFGYAPTGWALCNGQLMPINQNQALFSLLGTAYGGNGQVTFGLPDLRGSVPIHQGAGFAMGQKSGETAHTLSLAELPTHSHAMFGSSADASSIGPTGNVFARGTTAVGANPINYYSQTSANLIKMIVGSNRNTGGSQAHTNMQPFLTLNFCIALQGIFPSQN